MYMLEFKEFILEKSNHIKHRDKTMAYKFMYIPNNETQNYPFGRLQFMLKTFEHST